MIEPIVIKVVDKVPIIVSGPQYVVCDNSDYTVVWQLDEEWAQFESRTMQVNYKDGTYERVLFTGDSCTLPAIPVPGPVHVGLFAGDIHTTRPARLLAVRSATTDSGEERDPMPNGYAQAIEALDAKLDKNQGAENAGKAMVVDAEGNVVPGEAGGSDLSLGITSAAVGQIVKITEVDTDGKPTAWKAWDDRLPEVGGSDDGHVLAVEQIGEFDYGYGLKPMPTLVDFIPLGITDASPGQFARVKYVDDYGNPTAWEATTVGGSSGKTTYKLLCEQTLTEAVNSVSWTTDKDGNTFDFSKYAEVVLVWILSEDLAPDNATFSWCGDGGAFTNSVTIRKAVVKNMIFPEMKRILKDAIMFGNASYMWQSASVKERTSWLSSYDSEANLKPASIGLTTFSKLMPIGTYIGVLVR